ncbi:MAG: polysaccharide biosynthesis C-terminal domain-containing protein, partial [Clostridia bacterium]|nr:polysaccharide biosynthesis C-terminal domain-containing protein [Clostridia bacterium]
AAIAPALFFICIASALLGWSQGLEDQRPASAAQVVEAGAKMLCGLLLGAYALRRGLKISTVAAYAITGLTVGSFLGMAVMLLSMQAVKNRCRMRAKIPGKMHGLTPRGQLLRRLMRIALPVTLSASVMSLCDMLDSMIVIRRLCGGGMAETEALRLYGNYTALAVPMFNLPPVLIYPVTTALIPVLTAAYEDRGAPQKCHRLIRVSLSGAACIALPCSAGMSVLAEPILRLFYREDLAATGAPLLAVLALAVFFLSVLAMTNAVLQALECARLPLYSMLAGAAVKLLSSWILTGQKEIGIFGTPISTVLCYLTMAVCNLYFVMRVSGVSLPFVRLFAKPAAASVFCATTAKAFYTAAAAGACPEALCTLGAVGVGAVTYRAVLMLLRGIDEELLQLLPGRLRGLFVRGSTAGSVQRRVVVLSGKQKRSSALSKRR